MSLPPPPTRKGSNPPPPPGKRPTPPPNPPRISAGPPAAPQRPKAPPLPTQTTRPPAPRKIERLLYTSDVPITPQAIIDRARVEALHPYATAYRMDEPLPWGFGLVIWVEARALETKRRLGLSETRPLGDEYGGEVLADMCAYLNAKIPKFAVR